MKDRIKYNQKGEKEYVRFGLNIRMQHIVLMISTMLLILTGLPLKFFTAGWAKFIMTIFGGTEGARQIHHLAALGLIFIGIYHLAFVALTKTGRSDFKELIPAKKDFADFLNQIKFFFGRSKVKSSFGRFSFIEKFDYWAVYWGFVIMIGSGLVMWLFQGKLSPWLFGEIDLSLVPLNIDNYVHAVSREAHSDEALLATLAIIVWHFYNVHFNPDKFPGNKVWLTGTMSKKEMEEEHPLELAEIEDSAAEGKNDEITNENNGDEKSTQITETEKEETGTMPALESELVKDEINQEIKNELKNEEPVKNDSGTNDSDINDEQKSADETNSDIKTDK